jgi:endonuclease/exonuclease/phosphatase family metal-dependent hydrolase
VRVRIATYNVHGCVGTDGRFDVPRVADAIAGLEAQIVLLQEVGDARRRWPAVNQAHDLAEACGMGYVVGYTMPVGPWGYGNAVLTRLPIGATDRFDLSVERKEPRGCLRVGLRAGERALSVIGVHLGLSRSERRQQLSSLLDGPCSGGARALVIGGDFNDFPPGPTSILPRHRFVDAAREGRDLRATFPSRLPVFRLDRLYARGALRLRGYNVMRSKLYRIASDHLPVIADYEIEEVA